MKVATVTTSTGIILGCNGYVHQFDSTAASSCVCGRYDNPARDQREGR